MTAHRYWRIRMMATEGTAFAFSEIEFRTTAGVSLPFSGGTASASSTIGSFVAANATDGNIATLWASNSTIPPQWWAYDFGVGNSRDVVEIAITTRADNSANQAPTDFVPEWSDDGTTWHGSLPIRTTAWTTLAQVQVFAVTQLATTGALLTQIALEHWTVNQPIGQMTQIALEQWASVAGAGLFSARHV